jgi:outer membrane receptor protein involved in Fe transport
MSFNLWSLAERALACACIALLFPALAAAQTPTGTISGRVTDSNGGVVRGATVSIESPSLQGARRTSTTQNGDYIFGLLPPGPYTLTVEAGGFTASKRSMTLNATERLTVDVTIAPAGVTEAVDVVAESNSFVATAQASTNFTAPLLGLLPTARTVLSAVDLSPSVHATAPNGARSIGGAMSFENQFTLNGVQIQDNLRGTPLNLFIEDAIQETTTTTSGMSAEYGRLTGGAVNTITKSGGNMFSGSYRTTFTNDDWRTVSPFGEPKTDATVPAHEFTIGGPIARDRTWFFGAARFKDETTAEETIFTRIPFDFRQNEKRFEGKITHALTTGHRLQAGYIGIRDERSNDAFPSLSEIMDLNSLKDRELPQNLFSAHYTGQVGSTLFLEGHYARRTLTFANDGGKSTDLIVGTTLLDQQTGAYYWSPAFCGVCVDEKRDNDSVLFKGSYFLSTGAGAHNLVFGYDTFNDVRRAENHQSGSDYHVWGTSTRIENGQVFPVFDSGQSTWIIHWPIREEGRSTNFRTHSLFFNDSWALNSRWSFNLGLRYDKNDGQDASGNAVARDSAFSPRIGVSVDPAGDGRTTLSASYGRYVAAIANTIANSQSAAGTPSILAYFYQGEPINVDVGAPPVPTPIALQQLFDWFFADGGTTLFFADIPGLATRIPRSLTSPHADEFAVGLSRQIGSRGAVRLDFVDRKFGDFYGERIDTSTGTVEDEFGQVFDLTLVENTNLTRRRYRALSAQGNYRTANGLELGASYTLSRLKGNINGENIGSGPIPSDVLAYPEYFDMAWSFPEGDLEADQRHKLRVWSTYTLPLGGRHSLSLGAIQMVQSGMPYGAVGAIDSTPFVDNPGYATPPAAQISYFFTERDRFRTATMYRTDLAVNYALGLAGSAQFFAQAQILNLFNQFQAFDLSRNLINTTVVTAVDDPDRFAAFDPFTEQPVRGLHWEVGDQFGTPTGAGAYTLPLTFQFSAGFRF